MNEVVFKIEHIRIVWCHFHDSFHDCCNWLTKDCWVLCEGCCAFGDLVRVTAVMLFLGFIYFHSVFCFIGDRLLKKVKRKEGMLQWNSTIA